MRHPIVEWLSGLISRIPLYSFFRRTGYRLPVMAAAVAASAAYIVLSAAPSPATVAGTKHNFGLLSSGNVKSADTSEVCVFCHTPHNALPASPGWNRQDTGATYNVYESQTLAATKSPNAPALGQPTGSSKLCLSCHDGTIAIGSLLNLPGAATSGAFDVTGAGVAAGKISSTSTAYIGTDLKDDHPISFEYSLAYPSNTEIKDNTTLPPEIRLDSSSMVQCTSCHDPHGTAFPKFMVASLSNGGLCTNCHDKRYWTTMPSIHQTSTAIWNGSGVNPWHEDMDAAGYSDDTPASQSCLACHRSHGGAPGKTLLKGTDPGSGQIVDEEHTCLNCHNGNVATLNMDSLFNYTYKHDVKGTYGAHLPSRGAAGEPARESASNLGTNRHAECADCHNGHGVKSGNHVVGGTNGNIIGANLLGGWGAKPSPWGTAGNSALVYTAVDFTTQTPGADNLEGYLCVKCHSYYSYGALPPNVPSGNADGSIVSESDITADMNINNMAFHPVFAQGRNQPQVAANPNWPLNSLGLTNTFRYMDFPGFGDRTGFYNVKHDSTITCSDCHGSHSSSDPKGPHGSSEKWVLRRNETGSGTLVNFCYNCHRREVYGDENYISAATDGNGKLLRDYARVTHPVDGLSACPGVNCSPFYASGASTGNSGNKFGILCLTCHGGAYDSTTNAMKGIHGSNMAAGTQAGSDALGYRMMNGACVESYTRPTTLQAAQMWFRTVTPATDKVCNYNFTSFTNGNAANYNCNTIDDCSN